MRPAGGGEPRAKGLAKRLLYRALVHGGPVGLRAAWLRARGRSRLAVLLYHRVNDVVRDNLTTSPARFAEHLEMLGRRYRIIGLWEGVSALALGRDLGPDAVAITFDDGYADNCEVAAPILARLGLPATFFVTAGLIDTETPFPHDARSPQRFRAMRWAQVRSLAEQGFEIGSHGMTHANLARLPLDRARWEIEESRALLERRLGRPVRCFAYPFGAPADITPEVRAAIRAAGYGLIASAYGGRNVGRVDPWNVLRVGASEAFDPLALRAHIEGLSLGALRLRLGGRIAPDRSWMETEAVRPAGAGEGR